MNLRLVSLWAPLLLALQLSLVGGSASAELRQKTTDVNVTVLAYHDVTDTPAKADPDAVSLEEFSAQMLWLKTQRFTIISIQDYLDYRAGVRVLPKKPVLLTFDDGYESFYTHAFPILRALRYPSTLAIIGSWEDQRVPEGQVLMSPLDNAHGMRLPLVTPAQIKELSETGLVEIASHSYDLHHGELANPQGSMVPSASTRILTETYESEADYSRRLEGDLAKNSRWIAQVTGKPSRVMVWPYGSYTTEGLRAAEKTGHLLSLGLDISKLIFQQSEVLGRVYLTGGLKISRFAELIKNQDFITPARRHTTLQVTPAAFDGPGLSNTWLSGLVQSVFDSGVNIVLLSPFLADSRTCQSLIPSQVVPMAADVLSKISWQLRVRTGVSVLLDLNLESCALDTSHWSQFTEDLVTLVPSQGLVIRGTAEQSQLAQRLLAKAFDKIPVAVTASTYKDLNQGFSLISLDGCSPIVPALSLDPGLQYEVDTRSCNGSKTLESVIKTGARNFGTYSGFIQSSGSVPKTNRYLMNSLLALRDE